MALAAATHHSAPRGECRVPNDAPRGQKTASAAGKRPAPLEEVAAPQEGAVTVGYVAAPGPLLSTPMLADAPAEAVDARTVRFPNPC